MAPEPVADDRIELTESRSKIARVLLLGLAVLGLVAYVPSVLLAAHVGAWSIVVLDTVVYAAILAVLAFGKRRYALQAGVVVGVCFTLGIGLSALLGPTGGGPLWLLAAPVVLSVLLIPLIGTLAAGVAHDFNNLLTPIVQRRQQGDVIHGQEEDRGPVRLRSAPRVRGPAIAFRSPATGKARR